jgi:hypothetical protein
MLGYQKYWWVLVVVAVFVFVPGVFATIGGVLWTVTRTVVGTGSTVVSTVYDTGHTVVTGDSGPEIYTGREHLVNVGASFEVNQDYHGWGQLLRSNSQLPEISGRVYAARIEGDRIVSTLSSDTPLIAQRRVNWGSQLVMAWADLKVRAPEYGLPIGARTGWYVCVDLGEVSEGHNVLGHADDALHHVSWGDWRLTSGSQVVAGGECVELDNNSFPYEGTRIPLTREGETVPMGWFRIDFRGD